MVNSLPSQGNTHGFEPRTGYQMIPSRISYDTKEIRFLFLGWLDSLVIHITIIGILWGNLRVTTLTTHAFTHIFIHLNLQLRGCTSRCHDVDFSFGIFWSNAVYLMHFFKAASIALVFHHQTLILYIFINRSIFCEI